MAYGSDEDFQRIYLAMTRNDARLEPVQETGDKDALRTWSLQQLESFPGGPGAFAIDQIHRGCLMRLLIDSRNKSILDEAQFSAILEEITTVPGRSHVLMVLQEILQAREATHALMERLLRNGSFNANPYATTREELQRFLERQPSGAGPLVSEFLARKDVQRVAPIACGNVAVYEFSWGFITEEYGVWNIYAADVWRAGTAHYFDRFTAAWKGLAAPSLADATQRANNNFYVSFDDGSGAFSCISLGCVLGARGQRLAREWLAQVFIAKIWPQMLGQVLNSQHVFARELDCA